MTTTGPALLPARSVLLSVLLGSHPPRLPVRTLVRTAEMFGISDGTTRVALSRLTSDGEVVADGGTYRLSDRHLERQRDQDRALRPPTRPWRGSWDLAVLLGEAETSPEPASPDPAVPDPASPESASRESASPGAVRRVLQRRRMAEIRPGVWTRPDNLAPTAGFLPGVLFWKARPGPAEPPAGELAARLWDLEGWAAGAESLMAELAGATDPAMRLSVAAAMVRHIRSDPVLPPALLPAGWPGPRLRGSYDRYRAELGRLIAGLREG